MPSDALLDVLDKLPHPRVLVVGDLMLDRYTWGTADRISPEAPVLVLKSRKREARLGGAANVAHMVRGLSGSVTCVGVVGDDEAGGELRSIATAAGIDSQSIVTDATRPTTVKERFVGLAAAKHPNQILRVDTEECAPLSMALETQLVERIRELVPQHDIVLISDYGKGVCTRRLLSETIAAARSAGVATVVDPIRGGDFGRYRGCTVIKPNRVETEMATGCSIETARDALAIGLRLCDQIQAEYALVTLDRDGLALVPRNGQAQVLTTAARNVYDITGAGDMVLAAFGLCLAAGESPETAARVANVAGGLEVERTGVAIVTRDEIRLQLLSQTHGGQPKVLTLEQAQSLVDVRRAKGERVVFTNGCFDLLHVGHVQYLAEAAALGDVLVVGINSDDSVRAIKGPQRPVIGQHDRAAMLAALGCVSYVVVFDDETPHRLLHALKPDVLVKGGDYKPEEVVGHEVVEAYGGRVCVTRILEGISTTRIVEALHQGNTQLSILRAAG